MSHGCLEFYGNFNQNEITALPWHLPSLLHISSVQFSLVAQSCPTLCDPNDYSMPGLPVHHQLSELTQTHVHWISDAIQPSHPLSSPSSPAFNLSQHQGLFQQVSSSHHVAKVLELRLQHRPSNEYSGSLGLNGLISSQSSGLSRVLFSTTIQKHQFFCTQPFLWCSFHIHTWLLEKP